MVEERRRRLHKSDCLICKLTTEAILPFLYLEVFFSLKAIVLSFIVQRQIDGNGNKNGMGR